MTVGWIAQRLGSRGRLNHLLNRQRKSGPKYSAVAIVKIFRRDRIPLPLVALWWLIPDRRIERVLKEDGGI
ncbi:MAG: hypothetical protein ACREIF_10365 [Chthoniobacterales bacterium]